MKKPVMYESGNYLVLLVPRPVNRKSLLFLLREALQVASRHKFQEFAMILISYALLLQFIVPLTNYRIFSIKRQGASFKTRRRRPGVNFYLAGLVSCIWFTKL